MSKRGIRGLKTRMGREYSISREGARIVQSRYTCQRSLRKESQCYEWGHGRGAAPRVRAAKSSEFGEGKL